MKLNLKLFLLLTVLGLLLVACSSNQAPPLATKNQTTLVFVYTDG